MENIIKITTEFFQEKDWKYEVHTDDDGDMIFSSGVNLAPETVFAFYIRADLSVSRFTISGKILDYRIDTCLLPNALHILNEYNKRWAYIKGVIEDNEIFISTVIRLDDNLYLKSLFEEDMQCIIDMADEEIPKLYNQILKSTPSNGKLPKGFLSFLRK